MEKTSRIEQFLATTRKNSIALVTAGLLSIVFCGMNIKDSVENYTGEVNRIDMEREELFNVINLLLKGSFELALGNMDEKTIKILLDSILSTNSNILKIMIYDENSKLFSEKIVREALEKEKVVKFEFKLNNNSRYEIIYSIDNDNNKIQDHKNNLINNLVIESGLIFIIITLFNLLVFSLYGRVINAGNINLMGNSGVEIPSKNKSLQRVLKTMELEKIIRDLIAKINDIDSSVKKLKESGQNTGDTTNRTFNITKELEGKINDMHTHLKKLSDWITKITEILNLIQRISNQTNLYILNETINVARAGSTGKGFAAAASEVKALADRTIETLDITHDSITDIEIVIKSIGELLKIITENIINVNDLMLLINSNLESALSKKNDA